VSDEKWRKPQQLAMLTSGVLAVCLLEELRKQRFAWLNIVMRTLDEVYEIAALWAGQGPPAIGPGEAFLESLQKAELFAKAFKLGYEARAP
jgi:hypothetical protein